MPEWDSATYARPERLCIFNSVSIEALKPRLNRVLEATAKNTRQRIRETIPADQNHRLHGRTWETFWVLRNPADDDSYADTQYGFAPYGEQKREGFEKLCKGSEADRALCLGFFKSSFDHAVTASVKALLLINSSNPENAIAP
jgi:hypothetical protein